MKKRKSLLKLLVCTCFILVLCSRNIYAQGNKTSVQMPNKMLPYTVVIFDDECKMHIIRQGWKVEKSEGKSNPNNEDTSGLEEEEALIAKIREEAKNFPHYYIPPETEARPNTIVVYGTDGKISRIRDITVESLKVYAPEGFDASGLNIKYSKAKIKVPKLDKGIEEYVIKELKKAYDEYYVLSNITISISDIKEEKDKVVYFIGINFHTTLKAKDASELPYLKGMEEGLKEAGIKDKSMYNSRLKDINDHYIGKPQEVNDSFKIIIAKANGKLDENQIEMRLYQEITKNIVNEASMEEYRLKSFEETKAEGKASVKEANLKNNEKTNDALKAIAKDNDMTKIKGFILWILFLYLN